MRGSTLILALSFTAACAQEADAPDVDGGREPTECRGPGNYQAGKEGSYRPCCEGLNEVFQELPATDDRGARVCIAPPLRVYACVEGRCGDGRCEEPEAVPCGCAADCPDAALP